MSAYIEYGDTIAFHPGWYVKEIMDESNLDDEDFAGMLGTSKEFWLNLQKHYLFVFFR